MLAKHVGQELRGCSFVGVPFAGGMCELAHIEARTLNVNDLHRHVINLARVMADPIWGPRLYRRLRRIPFHPDALSTAQDDCQRFERTYPHFFEGDNNAANALEWAVAYFVAAWMPRHGSSGTDGEFNAGISTRWNANGGDSAKHYWSAIEGIRAWRKILHRANFTTLDFRAFLGKCKDLPGHGIYSDCPFPGPGDGYRHKFTAKDHADLAAMLSMFVHTRVVCRFYDVPMIRQLYPEPLWRWRHLEGGRKQTNDSAPEVLLVLNGRR